MGFNFNPSLWFVCRLCRRSFASIETLKDHKLACHLGECLQIKCIVFEERLLNEEWIPKDNLWEKQKRTENAEPEKRKSPKRCRNKIQLDYGLAKESPFRNPYVSLTRLPELEVNSSLNNSSNRKRQRKNSSKRKQLLQRSKDGFFFEREIQLEKESAPANLVLNEDAPSDLNDVKDREFIVASVSPNPDGVSKIQFTSTLIPASAQEYQFLQRQYITLSNDDPDCATTIQSDQQELVSENEADDFNLNSTNVDFFEVQTLESEPQVGESNQTQQSAPFRNRQSITATDEAVSKPFMCETCFAFFRTKTILKGHMRRHSSFKPFKCSKCPSEFKRSGDFNCHQVVHGKKTKFKCRFCNKFVCKNSVLLDHERRHIGDRPFKCSVANCGYAASNKYTLSAHTHSKHGEELGLQQFVCPKCGKIYGVKGNLNEHIRNHHTYV